MNSSSAATRLSVAIDGPDKSDRRERVLHIDSADSEALTQCGEFKDFDANINSLVTLPESDSVPSYRNALGNLSYGIMSDIEGQPVYRSAPLECEVKENRFKELAKHVATWVQSAPGEEDDVFSISIKARFGRGFKEMVASRKVHIAWRLCPGRARSIPEAPMLGINSVDVDGVGEVSTPVGFKLDLMPHQRRSLAWMVRREKFGMEELCVSECRQDKPIACGGLDLRLELRMEDTYFLRGGLLCDVVGSGKTASILALVLLNSTYTYVPPKCRSGHDGPSLTKATLVLAPANVHAQWLQEVRKFCPDKFRAVSLRTLADLRCMDANDVMEADLVIAPYDIFAVDSAGPGPSLESMCWLRIVLDEFHELFSKRTPSDAWRNDQILRKLRSLEVGRRWAMSGTPDAFLNSPASLMRAANCLQCDVSIRSAATFVELFCRQARVSLPVEVHQHVVAVQQTAEEHAVYLEQLSGGTFEDTQPHTDMEWSGSGLGLEHVRRVLVLCSHFTTSPGNLTAEEVCARMLEKKLYIVKQARSQLDSFALSDAACLFDANVEKMLNLNAIQMPEFDSNGNLKDQNLRVLSKEGELFQEAACQVMSLSASVARDKSKDEQFSELLVTLLDACQETKAQLKALTELRKDEELKKVAQKLSRFVDTLETRSNSVIDAMRRYDFFNRTLEALNGQAGCATCPVCLDEVDVCSTYVLFCGHAICAVCARHESMTRCPVCRFDIPRLKNCSVRLDPEAAIPPRSREPLMPREHALTRTCGDAHWGSKLRAFVSTLENIRSREPDAKVIVFMQWESLRIQTGGVLTELGIPYLSLEGNIFERTRSLQEFQSDAGISLLLLSLEHSASGTNLTVASHVFLMHPMLGSSQKEVSSYEAQAIGRVVRLGQTRPVHVWRFVASNTVEETMWRARQPEVAALTTPYEQ